jgi:hypothetical protein
MRTGESLFYFRCEGLKVFLSSCSISTLEKGSPQPKGMKEFQKSITQISFGKFHNTLFLRTERNNNNICPSYLFCFGGLQNRGQDNV